jgi:hypothetical protein
MPSLQRKFRDPTAAAQEMVNLMNILSDKPETGGH